MRAPSRELAVRTQAASSRRQPALAPGVRPGVSLPCRGSGGGGSEKLPCPVMPSPTPRHSPERFAMSAFSEDTAYASILILLVGFFILWVSWLVTGIEMRGRLSRLDFKLDLLLKHAGVEYDPYKNLPRDVVDALRRSQKIQAIQRYRKVTGVGLKEAKDFIEDVQRRSGDAS